MASPPPPLVSIPIPDDLQEEIFLRLPTPDAVAHASAACTSFRRVIKGRAFRRRFRALHRPPLLGFMDAAGFHPAQAPHPSAPLAGALALAHSAADFSFVPAVVSSSSYFMPPGVQDDDGEGPRWRACDGRVLLDWRSLYPRVVQMWSYPQDGSQVSILMDYMELRDDELCDRPTWTKRGRCNAADFHLAVCDPLSSRYVLLPTIPEDLASQSQPKDHLYEFEPVLAPNTSVNGEEEPFKVMCIARYRTKLVLFVFPFTTMQMRWYMLESPIFPSLKHMSCFDCVRGCFYWAQPYGWSDHLMVLDARTLRFSTVDLLTGYHLELSDLPDKSFGHRNLNAVVMGREGVLEMFSLVCQHGSFAIYHTSLKNNSQQWKLEKIIQLPGQYHSFCIMRAAEGFLFFRGAPEGIHVGNVDCYSMEVKTYEITKVCTKMENTFNPRRALPFFSFPRLLSEPTI